MELTSPDFENSELIPTEFTCDGENVSPVLNIECVPDETRSLVLIMDDPDAPEGTWTHWTVWNIDPSTEKIASDTIPMGAIEGTTSFDEVGYKGPCPPSGTHRYFFKLYAIDRKIDLPHGAPLDELLEAIEGNILAESTLVGLYSRDVD